MIELELTVSNSDYKVIDWKMFYDLAEKTVQKLKASGYYPDLIVGLTPDDWILSSSL